MKQIAVLSIAKVATLAVLNMEGKEYNMVSVQTLEPSKCLTETSAKLKGLELEELHVVLQGSITSETGNQVVSYTFGKGRNKKYSIFYKQDLQKIKTLGSRLNVSTIKIYDIIDIISLMGRYKPIVLVGDYLNNRYSYIYVSNGAVEDYRIWREIDSNQIQNLKNEYRVDYVESVYNSILDKDLRSIIINWDTIEQDYRDALSLTLGCLLIKPKIVSDLKATALNSTTGFHKPILPRGNIEETMNSEDEDDSLINVKEVNIFSGNKGSSNKSVIDKIFDTVAIALIITAAGCFVSNKQLPEDTEYLKNKQSEFNEILEPKNSVKKYYDNIVDKGGSYDKEYLDKIKAIEVNGYLAEVKLQSTSVAIVLYIKGGEEDADAVKGELEKYLNSLREFLNVTQIADQGISELEDTKLTKYVINATRE